MLVSILWENYNANNEFDEGLQVFVIKFVIPIYFKLYRNKAVTNTALYLYNLSFNVKCFWGKKGHRTEDMLSVYENLPVSWEYQDVTCHWAMHRSRTFLKIWTQNCLLTSNGIHLHAMHILTYTSWCGKMDKRAFRQCELIILISIVFVPTFYV